MGTLSQEQINADLFKLAQELKVEIANLKQERDQYKAKIDAVNNPHIMNHLIWLLWHHQGSKSDIGQPIRKILGIGQFDRLNDEQLSIAKKVQRELDGNEIESLRAQLKAAQEPTYMIQKTRYDENEMPCGTYWLEVGSSTFKELQAEEGNDFVGKILYAAPIPAQQSPDNHDWLPVIKNYADGVDGHYSIARFNPELNCWEFWNLRGNKWASCSDEVLSIDEAKKMLKNLTFLQQSPVVAVPSTLCKQLEIVSKRLEKEELWVLRDTVNLAITALSSPCTAEKPAVAVPDELIDKIKNIWWKAKSSHIMRTGTAKEIIQTVLNSSPRITEQDAREIAESYWRFKQDNDGGHYIDWLREIGRALLDKLNEK